MKKRTIKNLIIIGLVLFILSWLTIKIFIALSIVHTIDYAKSRYNGDSVEALCSLALSDTMAIKERNKAIWALGQLKDERAITVLQGLLNDKACDHEKYVCQREVKKSLKKIEGGFWSSLVIDKK